MRIGVFGGTFDPVHYGHLILADQTSEYLELSKVLFIPSNIPPHKDAEKTTPIEYRMEMLKLAVSDNDKFELSTIESDREGKSYSYETFEMLCKAYERDTDFYFIIGSDVLYDLTTFKNFDILLKKCSFAVAIRPGDNMPDLTSKIEQLHSQYGARIIHVPCREIEISSTIIRGKIKQCESIRYMLPDSVLLYINENGLYRE